jgi:hypothetical protein
MKPSSRVLALTIGLATLTPSELFSGDIDAELLAKETAEKDPGRILTNSCDDEVNLREARQKGDLFVANQVWVSCWNARNSLVEVCPWMSPDASDLLAKGPHGWFDDLYEAEFVKKDTPEAVIDENNRVLTEIERLVSTSLRACVAQGKEGRARRKCQRRRLRRDFKERRK